MHLKMPYQGKINQSVQIYFRYMEMHSLYRESWTSIKFWNEFIDNVADIMASKYI